MTILWSVRAPSIAFAALFAGPALALDSFTLENVKIEGREIMAILPRVEFTDTNINRDDAAKLFSPLVSLDDRVALIKKLSAARIAIPEAQISGKNGGAIARGFVAANVDAGKVKRFDFAGLDGTFIIPDAGEGNVKVRPLSAEDADYSGAIAAMQSGDARSVTGRLASLTWAGFEAAFPDKLTAKDAPGGNMVHVDLGSVTHVGTYDGDVPLKGSFVMKNLVITPPKASRFSQQLVAFGYDKLDLGFTAAGVYDPAAKTYALDDFTLSGAGAGTIGLRGTFLGLEKSAFLGNGSARMTALTNGEVASLGIKFVNNGLVDKAIAFYGKMQNRSPDQVKSEIATIVTAIAPNFLGGSEASKKIAAAVAKFVANPASIALAMTARGAPVRFTDLWGIRDPEAFLARMDVDAIANQ